MDRAGGGTTLVLHAKATVVPGSPHRPEYMKAESYFPPAFLAQHPTVRPALLRMAQDFIVNVGVPTVEDWNCRARTCLGWRFMTTHAIPPANPVMLDVPNPEFGSCHYVFYGQPDISGTAALPPALPPAPPPAPPPVLAPAPPPALPPAPPPALPLAPPAAPVPSGSQASTEYNFEDNDGEFLATLTYHEFQEEIAILTSKVEALTLEVETIRLECDNFRNRNTMLEQMLEMEPISLPMVSAATPTRSLGKSPRKPVPRTPTAASSVSQAPGSPFVTMQSDRQRSPFASSSSRVQIPEPTTPSAPQRRTTRFAPVTSPSTQSATRAYAASENSRGPLADTTMLDHILDDFSIMNLRQQILLITKYVPANSDEFAKELSSAGVPKGAILQVMRATLFDAFDDE